MKVSIITSTYNSSATVADTLVSVEKQTYINDIEHIIIDGLSIDNTLAIVNHFPHVKRITSEKDTGIYDAMNKGINQASGEIIAILNSDDFYSDEYVIENVVRLFKETDCEAIYGDLIFVHPNKPHKILRKWIAGSFSPNMFLRGWMPPHPTFFVKKQVYERLGSFNLSLKSSADYELLIRFMYINKIKVSYLPSVLVHMRSGGQSTKSFKNRLKAHKEDYLAWRLNNVKPNFLTLFAKPMRKLIQFLHPYIFK